MYTINPFNPTHSNQAPTPNTPIPYSFTTAYLQSAASRPNTTTFAEAFPAPKPDTSLNPERDASIAGLQLDYSNGGWGGRRSSSSSSSGGGSARDNREEGNKRTTGTIKKEPGNERHSRRRGDEREKGRVKDRLVDIKKENDGERVRERSDLEAVGERKREVKGGGTSWERERVEEW